LPFAVVHNDITKMRVDAIVNAANTALRMGGGVCGAIFGAAGASELQSACDALAPIETGEAVITPGFALPAKYVIHTAGPVYEDGRHGEEALLRACYTNSLTLAKENGCKSVAFPLISSGIYGYPRGEALSVATDAIGEWLLKNDMDVSLVVFGK
jgi:O-acetyl-ADP-ribose deacetylase (regulator of RNase III)